MDNLKKYIITELFRLYRGNSLIVIDESNKAAKELKQLLKNCIVYFIGMEKD